MEERLESVTFPIVKDNDNCPSHQTQDTHKLVCPEGKLCPGMTKQAVIELLGEPEEVEVPFGYDQIDVWSWDRDSSMCVNSTLVTCKLVFEDNLLIGQKDLNPYLIDLTGDWQAASYF